MDVIHTLHPLAHPLLFQHKRKLLSVFSDVIGINEIDHISMACITHANEIIYLSHTPSIEYQLMTSDLWSYDALHAPHFYTNDQPKLWSELYHSDKYHALHAIKQAKHGFKTGFSIPTQQHGLHLVYSFATKSPTPDPDLVFLARRDEFLSLGHYCFNKLSDLVLPHVHASNRVPQKKSRDHLTLVVNNTRHSSMHSEHLERV